MANNKDAFIRFSCSIYDPCISVMMLLQRRVGAIQETLIKKAATITHQQASDA